MNQAILSILSQKKSSHGNLRIHKFPVVRKYLRIRNFPVVRKKIYGSVSEAGELGLNGNQHKILPKDFLIQFYMKLTIIPEKLIWNSVFHASLILSYFQFVV